MGRPLEQDWEGILSMERCVKKEEMWGGQKEKKNTSYIDYTEQSKLKLSGSVGSEVVHGYRKRQRQGEGGVHSQ